MDIIDNKLINAFVTYFGTQGSKYSYFRRIPSKSIKKAADVNEYCKNAYEVGIAFQTGKQKYKDWDYTGLVLHISNRIFRYFNAPPNQSNTQADFDSFHKSLCDDFIRVSSKYGKIYSYGNAQKYINMCFKYLACFSDYSTFADLFSYCHMPIDSNILEKLHNSGFSGITRINGTYKFSGKPWTQFDYPDYRSLVINYKTFLTTKNHNCSSLNFDFSNWTPPKGTRHPITFASSGKSTTRISGFFA